MAFRVWGIPYAAGELSNTTLYQPIKPNTDMVLKAIRTWVIFYDDPEVTSFNMKIYSDAPATLTHETGKLLHTSTNTLTKSDIITLENGVKEIYFEFANINLQASTWYNFVLQASGYNPTGDAHIAWRQAFPDPVYTTNLSVSAANLNRFPFAIYFASGAEF